MDYMKLAIAKRRQKGLEDNAPRGDGEDAMGGDPEGEPADDRSGAMNKDPGLAPERKSGERMVRKPKFEAANLRDATEQIMSMDEFDEDDNGDVDAGLLETADSDDMPDTDDPMGMDPMMAEGRVSPEGDPNMDKDQLEMLMGLFNEDAVGKPGLSGRVAGGLKAAIDKLKMKKQG